MQAKRPARAGRLFSRVTLATAAALGATLSVATGLGAYGVPGQRPLEIPALSDCGTAPLPATLDVVSYNIRAGRSSSVEQVRATLAALRPQLVALQEVDRDAARTGRADQLQQLADGLDLQPTFYAARREVPGWFGNALLSALPVRAARGVPLDAVGQISPRSALDTQLCLGGQQLRVVVVHADVLPWASAQQCGQLAAQLRDHSGRGLLVLGDFNQEPGGSCARAFAAIGLRDLLDGRDNLPTFRGELWPRRLDYVFADAPLAQALTHIEVIDSPASDHRPVLARFDTAALQRALAD